jgi:PAS domain S-box-containing protein
LEERETSLWRLTLLIVVLLGTATAISFWENLSRLRESLPGADALAAGVGILMALFAAYVWKKRREISELRGFIRGMQARSEGPPSEQQVERLLEVVARSQQGYRDLIDSFDDLVFTCSLEGELLAGNRAVADILDQPFSRIIGKRLEEFIEEPARAAVEKGRARFLEKRHWQGVVRVRFKAGGVRYLDCVLQAIVKEGQVTGASCLARDVTQQRESEQRFKELFETLQEGVYFTTPEGKILDANPTLVRMLGYDSSEELLEKNVRDLYVEPGAREALLARLEKQGTVRSQEIRLRRKDGREVVCTDNSSAIRDGAGKVVRYQGALVDVTERRQIEKKLHEEQEFARRLVASFPDLIIVLDREFRYTFVSPNIEGLLGYRPEELLGRVVGERSHPDDRGAMGDLARQVLAGRTSFATLEYRTQHKDGSWRTFRATASPLYGTPASGPGPGAAAVTGLIASSRDVTALKRLEQQVIQSEKLAAMGQMIAGVAHELNNPLTAIVGISDLLREQAVGESATRRQLDLVNQQARRAADIVSNLLAFSRPSTAHKGLVSLNDLLRRTLQLHEYTLRVNNIAVDFLPAQGLPPVLADSNQLMQVFLNLIVNAEQAIRDRNSRSSSPSPGQLTVRLGSSRSPVPPAHGSATAPAADSSPAGDSVWVTFQDNGPGIPPDVLPKIFDPFFTTKRPGRGTGLGLSICMALIREHGGNIEASDAPGGGALFRITLPRAPRTVASTAAAAPHAHDASAPPHSASLMPPPASSSPHAAPAAVDPAASASRPAAAPSPPTADAASASPAAAQPSAPPAPTSASLPASPRPAAATPPAALAAASLHAAAASAAQGLAGHRVLVVDDEESIRELVEAGLTARGMNVECAASGEDALRLVERSRSNGIRHDLVLCDVKMPGLSGDQLFARLRALLEKETNAVAQPEFIFMTGDVMEPAVESIVQKFGARFVHKPFRVSDLVPILVEVLAGKAKLKPV